MLMPTTNRVLRWPYAVVACLLAATTVSAQRGFGPRDVDALPSSTPTLVARYGTHALAFGELRIPSGPGPFPVAVALVGHSAGAPPITNGNHFDVIGPGRAVFPAVLSFIRGAMGIPK